MPLALNPGQVIVQGSGDLPAVSTFDANVHNVIFLWMFALGKPAQSPNQAPKLDSAQYQTLFISSGRGALTLARLIGLVGDTVLAKAIVLINAQRTDQIDASTLQEGVFVCGECLVRAMNRPKIVAWAPFQRYGRSPNHVVGVLAFFQDLLLKQDLVFARQGIGFLRWNYIPQVDGWSYTHMAKVGRIGGG